MHRSTSQTRNSLDDSSSGKPSSRPPERRLWVALRDVQPWLVAAAVVELGRRLGEHSVDIDQGRAQVELELSGSAATEERILSLANELGIALEVLDR